MKIADQILVLLTFVFTFLVETYGIHCNKQPLGVTTGKSHSNGQYFVEIVGNPQYYISGDKYKVKLRGVSDHTRFTDFILTVENDEPDRDSGTLDVLNGDALTMFHDKCRNTITQTSSVLKTEIEVIWVAPTEPSGCVVFRATVVVNTETWYSDDGHLSLRICENSPDFENIEPPILDKCCACHEAKYEVTFESLWSRNTHPKNFPADNFNTKFSDIIGATHTVDYQFWSYNGYASDGLTKLAEHGNTTILEKELKHKSEDIRTIIKARGVSYPNITGKTFAVFRVDRRHHLMSLVSMISPSPDWIVGVSSLELCQPNCSWVESKTLNLFPYDVGTDNGTTYTSDNSPIYPRERIRKITSSNSQDSPFYDENGGEMKPLARLILSRQRLYEKHNCEEVEYGEQMDEAKYCAVTEWSNWTPCNVACGRGMEHRQRSYKYKVQDRHKQSEFCNQILTRRRPCTGLQRECIPERTPIEECELTSWGEWSECSVTCGNGTKTRSRRYKGRYAVKHCQQVTQSAPKLEENIDCFKPPCINVKPIPQECLERAWSEWSPCSVTCGKGTKTRTKLLVTIDELNRHNRLPRDSDYDYNDSEDVQDICAKYRDIVECVNDDAPSCEESAVTVFACSLPLDVGLCRSNVDRWHFNSVKGKCELFSYSGCEGNKNNFRTLETCEKVCGDLIANRSSRNHQIGSSTSGHHYYDMQFQNDERHLVDHILRESSKDCVYSKWSRHWSQCNVSCGKGLKFKTRKILREAKEGGKPCREENLIKERNCRVPCKEDVDCEMSEWSSWAPCNFSCGPDAVQQRTRNIIRHPSGNGKPCPDRIDRKSCNLSVCPDF